MPTLAELKAKYESLMERAADCENQAREHEQKARDLRAERTTCKLEAQEIRQQIGSAAHEQAARDTAAAAKASQHVAEQTAQAMRAQQDEFAQGLAQVNALKAELADVLAGLKSQPPAADSDGGDEA